MSKKIGIYIHIPFCKQKCYYCDFVSFANQESKQKRYLEALKKEITNWKKQNEDIQINTLYIGGGTPSYVDSKELTNIIKQFKVDDITIEVNPGTATFEKLKDYKNAGVTRLSIGLQSTKNELLKQIGRIHTFENFLETFKMARNAGFNNINVDLMIGLPNQTIKDIKDSLQKTIKLNPEHISVYSLIVEENTSIYKFIENGILELPDVELERNMYWYVKNFLELYGYKHYEISNFAKPGFESRHNLDCWEQKQYRGFGLAAHSYIDGKRFCNTSNLEEYIENRNNTILLETQEREDMMKEYMMLGLRKIDGISITKFEEKFNENPIMYFRKELDKLVNEELIIVDGDIIKLSNKGLDLANLVWEEFV